MEHLERHYIYDMNEEELIINRLYNCEGLGLSPVSPPLQVWFTQPRAKLLHTSCTRWLSDTPP